MHIPFSDKLNFFKFSLKKNSGPLSIGLIFIIIGVVLMYIGYFIADNNFLIGFGFTFFSFSGSFLLYTMPSSFTHYYEQALTKKYGKYATAKVIKKRIDDYSYTSNTFESGQLKHYEELLYAIEFQFDHDHITYYNECFFEDKTVYDAITIDTPIPIKFLRNNPEKVTVRHRKLSNDLDLSQSSK